MQYHTLNRAAESIWRACDGMNDIDTLATATGFPVELVEMTLGELAEASLFDDPTDQWSFPLDRRQAIRRISAGIAGLPIIVSITAPEPAAAASANYCRDLGYLPITCTDTMSCQIACPPTSTGTCVQVDMTGIGCCKCSNTVTPPDGN